MTKRTYLKRLRKALGRIPEHEKEDIISYYNELIEESYDRGKTTRQIFSELDTPEQAAENYLREGITSERRPVRRQRETSVWSTLLLPVRIVLGIALVIAGIVLVSLTIAFGAAGVAVGIASIYTFVMSFGPLTNGHPAIAFAQFGVAIACMGISGLFFPIIALLWKLNGMLWRFVSGRRSEKKPVRRSTVRMIAIGVAELVLGAIVFTAAFGGLDFKYENLAVTDGIETCEQVVTEPIENFSLESDNLALTVLRSEGEELRVVYRELEDMKKLYSFEDGKLTLKEQEKDFSVWFGVSEHITWKRGIFFSAVARELYHAEIYLPASFEGDLNLKTDNGTVNVSDMVCANLVIETDNGAVTVTNVTAQNVTFELDNGAFTGKDITAKTLRAETDNGLISLERVAVEELFFAKSHNGVVNLAECSAESFELYTSNGTIMLDRITAEKVEAETNNGAVRLTQLDAKDITLQTDNGSISGSIVGSRADYAIEARVKNGSCNLPNKSDGERRLKATSDNGSIKITFTE